MLWVCFNLLRAHYLFDLASFFFSLSGKVWAEQLTFSLSHPRPEESKSMRIALCSMSRCINDRSAHGSREDTIEETWEAEKQLPFLMTSQLLSTTTLCRRCSSIISFFVTFSYDNKNWREKNWENFETKYAQTNTKTTDNSWKSLTLRKKKLSFYFKLFYCAFCRCAVWAALWHFWRISSREEQKKADKKIIVFTKLHTVDYQQPGQDNV